MTVLLKGTVSDSPHILPRPQPSPPLSAQVSSNGRDSRRTFLRIDGVTEAVRPGGGLRTLPTQGRGLRDWKALTSTGAAWSHTQTQAEALWGGGGVRHAKLVWAPGEGSLEEAAGKSPQECPAGLDSVWQLDWGCLGMGGPPWSFPIPSHFLLLPHPQVPEERVFQDTLGLKKLNILSAEASQPMVNGPKERGRGRKSVGRCLLPSRDQKQGPGIGRGDIWVLLAPLRSRSGRRLAPGLASCHC